MRYSDELIEEIRIQNDIVDVIGSYMTLTRKGNSYFGLCPFHNENTPSFSVSADKQFYYCFGCGASGNVYSFVMKNENCDFLDSVNILANRVGIELPSLNQSEKQKELERKKNILFEINSVAGRYYYDTIISGKYEFAHEYINKRGILPNIQKKFGIGYSPRYKNDIYKYLLNKGYDISDILDSGLVIKSKSDTYYDRFSDRIMFPIIDTFGRIVGFGGRALNGEPKYLNSPETLIFNKSKTLYGLNFARLSKKREIILVEGYMDMISVYQAGFTNVCASLGTSFNSQHAKVLKKYADDIIILYDSDDAGINATLRAIDVLTFNGFNVKVLQVPNCKDPDDFIKNNGVSAFSELISSAKSYIYFKIDCKRKQYNIDFPEQKIKFTIDCANILSKLSNSIEMDVYIKEISNETGISEESIKKEIAKLSNNNNFVEKRSNFKKPNTDLKGVFDAQMKLLYIISKKTDTYKVIKNYIKPNEFFSDVYKNIATVIFDIIERGGDIFEGELMSYFKLADEQNAIGEIFMQANIDVNNQYIEKAINESVKIIKRKYIDNLIENAKDTNELKNFIECKINIDKLYINLLNG